MEDHKKPSQDEWDTDGCAAQVEYILTMVCYTGTVDSVDRAHKDLHDNLSFLPRLILFLDRDGTLPQVSLDIDHI